MPTGNQIMVKLLIDSKADVNIAAKDGSTPLHVAFKKGKLTIYLFEKPISLFQS